MTTSKDASTDSMDARISRYDRLQRLPTQQDVRISQEALDVIYARELLPVIGPEQGESPIASAAPIKGAGGITMTIARCPIGQSPALHIHKTTYETFTVLKGEFELIYGEVGQHRLTLRQFDTASVPPQVMRTFRNIGEGDGLLQVIVSGGSSFHDIDVSPDAEKKLSVLSPLLLQKQKDAGITFGAGVSE